MNAARILRQARKRSGMTQRELAVRAGVPQPSIARIEGGGICPRVDTLDRLLEACGEGLYAEPRRGVGIDRSLIAWWRSIPEIQRLRVAEERPPYGRPKPSQTSRPGAAFAHLIVHEVRFVVIGGVAAQLLGAPVVTFDADVCYSRDPENLERLVVALEACNASLRKAPDNVPTPIDLRRLKFGMNFTLDTDFGPLDILGEPAGVRGYEELVRNAEVKVIDDVEVLVVAVSDLIRMKLAAGRRKDLMMAEDLAALQEELDRDEERRNGL